MPAIEEGNCFVQIDCRNSEEKELSYYGMNSNSRKYNNTMNISDRYDPCFIEKNCNQLSEKNGQINLYTMGFEASNFVII